jgi:hypothetical protein
METRRSNSDEVSFFNPPLLDCADQDHYPFKVHSTVHKLPLDIQGEKRLVEVLLGTVRTSSYDFNGERTDLHDVWSISWAAFFRSFGVSSSFLVSEIGFAGLPALAG